MGIKLGSGYSEMYAKYFFKAPDKRDGHLIRYLLDFGFYKARFVKKCKNCGADNSRTHITNLCPAFEGIRERIKKKLMRVTGRPIQQDLESEILKCYFDPQSIRIAEVLDVLKTFSIGIIIQQCKNEKEGAES